MLLLDAVYNNFTFRNPTVTLTIVIWGLYAGFVLAGIATVYNKWYLGALVHSLIRLGATSPDKALTFEQTGLKKVFRYRSALCGGSLSRYIKVANAMDSEIKKPPRHAVIKHLAGEPPKKYSADTAAMYIPERLRTQAQLRYTSRGSSPLALLICVAVLLALAVGLFLCIPLLLDLLDSVISMYKSL